MRNLLGDLLASLTRLRRSWGSSVTVIGLLALATAINATALGLLNATVWREIDVPDAEGMVAFSQTDVKSNRPAFALLETLSAFRRQQRSFSHLSLYASGVYRAEFESRAADAGYEAVDADYFEVTGVRPLLGRSLVHGDNLAGAPPVGVISHRLWHALFNGREDLLGASFKIDGRPTTIVGVMPRGFHGVQADSGADVFLPIGSHGPNAGAPGRAVRGQYVIGRLASTMTADAARAEVLALWPAIQATTSGVLSSAEQTTLQTARIDFQSIANGFSGLRREYGTLFTVLAALAALLFVIGGLNLTGFMVVRALSRRGEFSLRMALGASRWRLFQQSVIDGLVIALCGFIVAWPMSLWAGQVLTSMLTVARPFPLMRPLSADGGVLLAALLLNVAIGVCVATIPLLLTATTAGAPTIGARAAVGGSRRSMRALIIGQIALSMVLVIAAGLLAGTLANLYANDLPNRSQPIVWTRLARVPGDRASIPEEYFHDLFRRLSGVPGANGAAFSSLYPAYLGFAGQLPTDVFALPGGSTDADGARGLTEYVSPGFFGLFGITRQSGRDFTWSDNATADPVAIISEQLAATLFRGASPLDRNVVLMAGSNKVDVRVIGTVADAAIGRLRDPNRLVLYRPLMQNLAIAAFPNAHVRVGGDVTAASEAYVAAVNAGGRHYVRGLFTLDDWVENAVVRERLIVAVSSWGAALALVLVCVGLYSALAFTVVSRRNEIGLRMAIGASRPAVLAMIFREGMWLVIVGILIGVPAALAIASVFQSQLYGMTPAEPAIMVVTSVVFMLTGGVAALIPALRASRIDPVQTLRYD